MLLQPKCGRHEPATESSGVDFWNSGVNQSLAGRTIPSSLQTLTFRTAFEQSLVTVILPTGLQTFEHRRRLLAWFPYSQFVLPSDSQCCQALGGTTWLRNMIGGYVVQTT